MREAFAIASGPSLTTGDVELVRAWRQESEDRFVIVANTTFRIAPWADAMFAMDDKWWKFHREEVRATFKGRAYCHMGESARGYAERPEKRKRFCLHGNSGAAILAYCCSGDFERIIMLGYDCSLAKGKHWHGDHPKGLGNCGSIHRWPKQFQNVRDYYPKANIVNASRQTALTMFTRVNLEDVLGIQQALAA